MFLNLYFSVYVVVVDFCSLVIHWVLTVPAIWKDNAKQFMREAAQQVFVFFVILNFYICIIPLKKTF
jgi:hypothetical protein